MNALTKEISKEIVKGLIVAIIKEGTERSFNFVDRLVNKKKYKAIAAQKAKDQEIKDEEHAGKQLERYLAALKSEDAEAIRMSTLMLAKAEKKCGINPTEKLQAELESEKLKEEEEEKKNKKKVKRLFKTSADKKDKKKK